jgi:hypothetical protein
MIHSLSTGVELQLLLAFLTVTGAVFWIAALVALCGAGWLMWRAAGGRAPARAFLDELEAARAAAAAPEPAAAHAVSSAPRPVPSWAEGFRGSISANRKRVEASGRAGRPQLRPTPCRFCRFVRELLNAHRRPRPGPF